MRYKVKVVTITVHWITTHEDTPEAARARVGVLCDNENPSLWMDPDAETVEIAEVVEWPGPLFEVGGHHKFVREHQ